MTYKIYKLTNQINGKVYIGFTSQEFAKRLKQHKREKCKPKLYRAIRKYGFDNFLKEEICCTWNKDFACELEKYFIKLEDSFKNGYNCTEGGEGTIGNDKSYMQTLEYREKVSKGRKGKLRGNENPSKRADVREKLKGRRLSNEQYRQIGYKVSLAFTDDRKINQSKRFSGENNPNSKKWIISFPNGEKVIISDRSKFCKTYNLNYSTLARYSSLGKKVKGFYCEPYNC